MNALSRDHLSRNVRPGGAPDPDRIARLRRAVARGSYSVEPHRVAEAMLRAGLFSAVTPRARRG